MQNTLSLTELRWAERKLNELQYQVSREDLIAHYEVCGGLERLVSEARKIYGGDLEEIILEDIKFHEENPGYYEYVRLPFLVWKSDLIYATIVSLFFGVIYAFTKDNVGAAFTSAIFWYIVGGCWIFGASLMLIGTFLGTKIKKKYIGNIMMAFLGLFLCGGFYIAIYVLA